MPLGNGASPFPCGGRGGGFVGARLSRPESAASFSCFAFSVQEDVGLFDVWGYGINNGVTGPDKLRVNEDTNVGGVKVNVSK